MNVYKIEDGETHFVVAESEDDACAVMAAAGAVDATSADEYRSKYEPTIQLLRPDYMIGIRDDDDGKTRKAAEEWAADGRGYLCGSCW